MLNHDTYRWTRLSFSINDTSTIKIIAATAAVGGNFFFICSYTLPHTFICDVCIQSLLLILYQKNLFLSNARKVIKTVGG